MASAADNYYNAADEIFFSGGDCLAILDEDQMDFERENIFNQCDGANGLESSCVSLPDSWSLRSHLTLSPPSFMGSVEGSVKDCLRMSIGSFIGSKTEALGSLGAEGTSARLGIKNRKCNFLTSKTPLECQVQSISLFMSTEEMRRKIMIQEPTFGTEFSTPPPNRRPLPLMDLGCESDGSDDDAAYHFQDPDFYASSLDETLTNCNRIILPEETNTIPIEVNNQELSEGRKSKDSTNEVGIETGNDGSIPGSGGRNTCSRTALRNRVRHAFVQPLDVIVEVSSERNSSASSSRITNEMERLRESDDFEQSRNTNRTRTCSSRGKTKDGDVHLPNPGLDDNTTRPVVRDSVRGKDDPQLTVLSSSEAHLELRTPLNEPYCHGNGLYSRQHPEFYSLRVDTSRTENRTGEYTQELAVEGEGLSSATRSNSRQRDPMVERTGGFRSLLLSSSSYTTPGAQPSEQKDKLKEQLRREESQRPSRASVEQELILSKIKVMAANGELGTKFRNATNSARNQANSKDTSVERRNEMLPRARRKGNKENVDPKLIQKDGTTIGSVPLADSNENERSVRNSEGDISWKSPRKTPKSVRTVSGRNSERHLPSTTSVILSHENPSSAGVTVNLTRAESAAGEGILSQPVNGDDDTMSFSSVQTNFSEMFIGLPSKLLGDSRDGKRTGNFQVLTSEVGHSTERVGCNRGIGCGTELERPSNRPVSDRVDDPMAGPVDAEAVCRVVPKGTCPTDAVSNLSVSNKASIFSSSSAVQGRQEMRGIRTYVAPCIASSEGSRAHQSPALESYSSERINNVQELVSAVNDKFTASGASKFKSKLAVNLTNGAALAGDATSAQSAVLVSSAASLHVPTTQPGTTLTPRATSIQVATSLQSASTLPGTLLGGSNIKRSSTSLLLPRPSKTESEGSSCHSFAIGRFLAGENHSVHNLSDLSKRLPQNTQTLPRSSKDEAVVNLSSMSNQSSSGTQLTSSVSLSTLPAKRLPDPQLDLAKKTLGRRSLIVPLEVRVRDVCCVGLSTQDVLQVQNPSENWVKVTFEVTRVSVDGKPMNDCFSCPFTLKNKTLIEPKNSEEVKIVFVPRVSGVFVAQLHLHSSPVSADQHATTQSSKLPIMVTLQAIAEKPSIQVTAAGGGSNLHLGPIPWGNHSSGTICLINRSRAHIPVRLAISSISSNCCFSFEKQSESHASKIPSKRHPLTSLIYSCTLPSMDVTGCFKPVPVPIHFVSPDRQYGAVEEFRGRVVAEVDAISTPFHLGIVELIGKAGTAKIHVPRDMNELKFVEGRQDVFSVPMLNAGNIHIVVSLQISMSCEMFEVNPKEFILEPAQEKNVSIKFKPCIDSAANEVASILLIMVRPDGPFYKIRLFGSSGKSFENPSGKSISHHMMGFPQEAESNNQINYEALQEGFSNHLKDHVRLVKPLVQSKWEDATGYGKKMLQSTEIINRMSGSSEQQNARGFKEVASEPLQDNAISNKLSVKLHHSKDRDTLIHAIPEKDIPIAFLTSTSPTLNARSNASPNAMTLGEAAVWTVKPDKITLPSSVVNVNCEPVVKRIQIINYTKKSMPFKLSWPEKFITVTPELGNVLPRSSTVICLSANIGLQQKGLPLPWSGVIRILSETEAKHVRVKIIAEGECLLPLRQECEVECARSEFGQCSDDGVIGVVTIPDAELGDEASTTSRHQRLNFRPTIIKNTVERVLEISNLSGYHLKWTVTAFAPVYVKKQGESGCRRLLYAVFWLPLQSGILHPGGQAKVVVCFCPREVGFYSQFWEVVFESSDVRRSVSQVSRIELFASSVTDSRECSVDSRSNCSYCDRPMLSTKGVDSNESTGSPSSLEVPSRDSLISVMPLDVTFPVSAVNKRTTVKVVMKNRDSKPYMMEITEPDQPFHARHRKLKLESRHYLSVPFDFLPKAKGHYESTLLLKSDKGDAFTITLNGTCE